ncbi:MAG: LamG-like jellyroll fold domain-containing protein [Acidimicrobiia bacterium]
MATGLARVPTRRLAGPGAQRIDPSHPLARGLILALHGQREVLAGRALTQAAGVTFLPAMGVRAFKFGGTASQNVTVASLASSSTIPLTLEAWVYLDSASTQGAFIKVGDVNGGHAIGVGSGNMSVSANDLLLLDESVAWRDTATAIGTGLHHVVGVFASGSNNTLAFLDGNRVGVFTGGHAAGASEPVAVGGYLAGDFSARWSSAAIPIARVWRRALTAGEVARLYADPNGLLARGRRPADIALAAYESAAAPGAASMPRDRTWPRGLTRGLA